MNPVAAKDRRRQQSLIFRRPPATLASSALNGRSRAVGKSHRRVPKARPAEVNHPGRLQRAGYQIAEKVTHVLIISRYNCRRHGFIARISDSRHP
jgi:hypothetical protein